MRNIFKRNEILCKNNLLGVKGAGEKVRTIGDRLPGGGSRSGSAAGRGKGGDGG